MSNPGKVKKKWSKRQKRWMGFGIFIVILLGAFFLPSFYWTIQVNQAYKPESVNMGEMHLDSSHASHSAGTNQIGSETIHTNRAGEVIETRSCFDMRDTQGDAIVRSFEVTAEAKSINLDNGSSVDAYTLNGTTPGPEIRVKEGEMVRVHLKNINVEEGVTLHWHGVVLHCSQDGVAGVTQDAVEPGGEFTYEFIARHSGSFWYHSHQQSSLQAKKGLIGRFIVEPKVKPFEYEQDLAVTLQRFGNSTMLINSSTKDVHFSARSGEWVRLRIVNSDSRTQNVNVYGNSFQVVSIDGSDIPGPEVIQAQTLPIGAGQRYDILIQVPENERILLQSTSADRRSLPDIHIGEGTMPERGQAKGRFDFTVYGTPTPDDLSIDSDYDVVEHLILGHKAFAAYTINGEIFHHIPPIMVEEGDLVKISLTNDGGGTHPMHLHGHIFKVLSKNGIPLTSNVYMDTLPIEEGETFEIAFVADNPGLWMKHCHNLEHAASGMTMMVNYYGVTTPFTVGTVSGNLPD
ncbi:multicopper oxidase family protein [Paenibacillaceae bacterium]|nr:multicopper oxidase family protein [Paenibacillaceae bacterium]